MPSKQTRGGSLVNDVNKLVVPFGLLLAQRGLSKMVEGSKKKPAKEPVKEAKKENAAKKKNALNKNKRAAVGGNANSTTGSRKLVDEFNQLSNEIEKFLAKY